MRYEHLSRVDPEIRAVEPASCPSLTRGEYAYDFGDTAGMTPLMKMHTLGHTFIPEPIHAGGLRYHGMAPLVSHLYEQGFVEAIAIPSTGCGARGHGSIPDSSSTSLVPGKRGLQAGGSGNGDIRQ